MKSKLSIKNIAKITLFIIYAIVFLMIPISLPTSIGAIDFRPYWSSSFLLRNGQDFSNPSNMDLIERTLTGWNETYTMHAWFAPTGNLVLLPYTLFSFTRATYYWLITNIFIVFFSAILLWHNMKKKLWIPLIATFGFPATLLSLNAGQVNTLVVLGVVLFLFFIASKNDFAAGVSLALTTIKPHLVILTLPLVILDLSWRKKWFVLAGFLSTLFACAFILYILYPPWLYSFGQIIISGMNSFREAPSFPGLLVHTENYMLAIFGKWLWLIGLFSFTIVWWKLKNKLEQRILIDFSILIGMLISPIGWNYDHIMLLIPLIHVLEWISSGLLQIKDVFIITSVLIIIYLLSFYGHTLSISEVWFFWTPLAIVIIYIFAWKRKRLNSLNNLAKMG
jgi:hypothetical protein